MTKLKIGILSKGYAIQRLVYKKTNNRFKFVRFFNGVLLKNLPILVLQKIGILNTTPEKTASQFLNDFKTICPLSVDVLHTFNAINFSRRIPWVVSVESAVPWPLSLAKVVEDSHCELSSLKDNAYITKRLQELANPNCRGVLPLSERAKNIQLKLLDEFPEYREVIKRKVKVLPPPQELLVSGIDEKLSYRNNIFTFIFVGRNFFRKGGRESLKVLVDLHKEFDFKFILISSLSPDEPKYMDSISEIKSTQEIINENRGWIEYYYSLPNNQVLELMKKSYVSLLPTWMDTYGYSVLESQACALPVISTSICSLNEINTDDVGWRIKVPVNNLNNPIHNTEKERCEFREMLIKGLYKRCLHVLQNQDEVIEKAGQCIKRIKKYHNPEEYSRRLQLVYNEQVEMLP